MAAVTALHPERRDRVRVELDGAPWRILPAAAVVAAGLGLGTTLDRSRARELNRALRRHAALDAAGRALVRRDRSPAGLQAVLERRGVAAPERAAAVETLQRLGYLDEQRFAVARAVTLADRGFGDDAIRHDLEREGVGADVANEAIGALAAELDRARTAIATASDPLKAARRLAAKGFSTDVVSDAIESVAGRE